MITHWCLWLYLLLGVVTAGVEMTLIIYKKHPRQSYFDAMKIANGTVSYVFWLTVMMLFTVVIFPISWIGSAHLSHQRKMGMTPPPPPPPQYGQRPPPPPYPHGHPLHVCGEIGPLYGPGTMASRMTADLLKAREQQERQRAREDRCRFIEYHAASLQLASVRTTTAEVSSVMPPTTCVALATALADSLGIGVADCDKKTSELS